MMEVIVDELKKQCIPMDMAVLATHINYILFTYKDMYNNAANRLNSNQLVDVFHEMSINTIGRVVAYLTLVHSMNMLEEDVRKAVRLVVPALKNIERVDGIADLNNFARREWSFIHTLCSSVGYTPICIDTI